MRSRLRSDMSDRKSEKYLERLARGRKYSQSLLPNTSSKRMAVSASSRSLGAMFKPKAG